MTSQYLQVLLAFLLAQSLLTSIMVYNYQKEKNISWRKAMVTYLNAEVGYFVIGLVAIFGVLFVMSDFIDLTVTKQDILSLESRSWKQNLQLYFKSVAFLVGGFVQYIAFIYKKKGKAAIDKIADNI